MELHKNVHLADNHAALARTKANRDDLSTGAEDDEHVANTEERHDESKKESLI